MSIFSELRRGVEGFDLWPDEIPGLGGRRVGPFTRCVDCPASRHAGEAGTFVRYGERALCLVHAKAHAHQGARP